MVHDLGNTISDWTIGLRRCVAILTSIGRDTRDGQRRVLIIGVGKLFLGIWSKRLFREGPTNIDVDVSMNHSSISARMIKLLMWCSVLIPSTEPVGFIGV